MVYNTKKIVCNVKNNLQGEAGIFLVYGVIDIIFFLLAPKIFCLGPYL